MQKLGFDGFKDFKLQLIREASISGQDLNFNLPFSPDDSVEDIGLHLSEILANGIKKTRNLLDPVQLEMTAYNIKRATVYSCLEKVTPEFLLRILKIK